MKLAETHSLFFTLALVNLGGLEELILAKLDKVPGELIGELEISLVILARIVTAVSIGTLEQPWVWSTLLGYFRLWLRLLAGVHKSLFLPLS